MNKESIMNKNKNRACIYKNITTQKNKRNYASFASKTEISLLSPDIPMKYEQPSRIY